MYGHDNLVLFYMTLCCFMVGKRRFMVCNGVSWSETADCLHFGTNTGDVATLLSKWLFLGEHHQEDVCDAWLLWIFVLSCAVFPIISWGGGQACV